MKVPLVKLKMLFWKTSTYIDHKNISSFLNVPPWCEPWCCLHQSSSVYKPGNWCHSSCYAQLWHDSLMLHLWLIYKGTLGTHNFLYWGVPCWNALLVCFGHCIFCYTFNNDTTFLLSVQRFCGLLSGYSGRILFHMYHTHDLLFCHGRR